MQLIEDPEAKIIEVKNVYETRDEKTEGKRSQLKIVPTKAVLLYIYVEGQNQGVLAYALALAGLRKSVYIVLVQREFLDFVLQVACCFQPQHLN